MINLTLVIFLCTLINQIVSWVGKSVLQEIAFTAYSWVFLSGTSAKQRKLRKQVLEDKAELGRTSSQDEFAKWAKLRRKLDKGLADLEKANNNLSSSRSSFSKKFNTLLWLMTTGAQFLLSWWFRKQPIFWLPEGWVPYPVAWLVSFPSAPIGSVSSGAWGAICATPVPAAPSCPKNAQPEAKIEPLALEHEKLD
ncbi:protein GET1 [Cryptococcus deuterogattii LA55]|nr:protein GET1 [Cryptococcus deuterogattii LA55]KIR33467.1 protein GET1 [Cryptococcus deuterogattii MMRL2647]KIR73386.1 protein GET1 [Cryptococcus deuterogattii CA1014]KIR91721.1 protein GET1 [Cryptococcus deuterogattii CBS 10090]KIR99141.1 protein GET1 [Cryptococcus deuterogattii 2001/935-1]